MRDYSDEGDEMREDPGYYLTPHGQDVRGERGSLNDSKLWV